MPKAPASARRTPLLQSADFTGYLNEKCTQIAPGDVRTMLAQAAAIRRRARTLAAGRVRMGRQIELALEIVGEHHKGRCPQIPYYTIATLSVALLYFSDPVDVIPDWIPNVGSMDDAIVFELAFGMARAGIARYCAWKGIPTAEFFPAPPRPPARRTSAAKAPARRTTAAKQAPSRRTAAAKPARRKGR